MTCTNEYKSSNSCTGCKICGWNKQVNKERRGRLRHMKRQELGEFMLLWATGGAWK